MKYYTVEKITNGGWGLVRSHDGVVLLNYVLPGEIVTFRIKDKAKGIIWGELVDIITPSPHRISPPCPHFGQCGGCVFQHIDYPFQLSIKQGILCDDLKRIGHFQFTPLLPLPAIIDSPPFGNRVRARMKGHGDGRIGFIRKSTTTVFPIDKCLLFPTGINDFINQWNLLQPPPFFHEIDMLMNPTAQRVYAHLSHPPKQEKEILKRFPHLSFSWKGNEDAAVSNLMIGKYSYQVSPSVFFQVNPFQWEKMLAVIESYLQPCDIAVDLYCGVGFFIPLLQRYAKKVIGVESSGFSVTLAQRSFPGVEFHRRPVEQYRLPQADILLVDPPRSGLAKHVFNGIMDRKYPKLIYISCSSAAFSRDLKILIENGYDVQDMAIFDLFPQTAHLETITLFTRNNR